MPTKTPPKVRIHGENLSLTTLDESELGAAKKICVDVDEIRIGNGGVVGEGVRRGLVIECTTCHCHRHGRLKGIGKGEE